MNSPWMQTYTGKRFEWHKPTPEMISIEDIAHSLAMKCRFSGHTKKFYSVAEHCVIMSRYYAYNYDVLHEDPVRKGMLLHDAAEAYVGDMPGPLKALEGLEIVRTVEKTINDAICKKFGLDACYDSRRGKGNWCDKIKEYDARMLLTERDQLLTHSPSLPGDGWPDDMDPILAKLPCWFPDQAEREFLDEFKAAIGMPYYDCYDLDCLNFKEQSNG